LIVGFSKYLGIILGIDIDELPQWQRTVIDAMDKRKRIVIESRNQKKMLDELWKDYQSWLKTMEVGRT